jgi:hypothetical protein
MSFSLSASLGRGGGVDVTKVAIIAAVIISN